MDYLNGLKNTLVKIIEVADYATPRASAIETQNTFIISQMLSVVKERITFNVKFNEIRRIKGSD